MFRATAAVLITLVGISAADAADHDSPKGIETPAVGMSTAAPAAELAGDVEQSPRPLQVGASRGPVLPALYVSLAMLQAYDAYTTLNGVRHGAREANALMSGAATNSVAMWTVKGAATFTTIYLSERLWRQHRRPLAIAAMLASNCIVSAVAAHNASVDRAQR